MEGRTAIDTRRWQVLLLAGPSGTGKTAISYRLARRFDVGITEIDDFQVLLERLTTPAQQPALHFWRRHPTPEQLPPETILEHQLAVCRVSSPGLEAAIAGHLETDTPIVLEGDCLLPELAAQPPFAGQRNAGRVRALFLYEDDEQQTLANFVQREPERRAQEQRAHVSWLFGRCLRAEAARRGPPAPSVRP